MNLVNTLFFSFSCIPHIAVQAEGTQEPSLRTLCSNKNTSVLRFSIPKYSELKGGTRFASLPERGDKNIKYFIPPSKNRTHNHRVLLHAYSCGTTVSGSPATEFKLLKLKNIYIFMFNIEDLQIFYTYHIEPSDRLALRFPICLCNNLTLPDSTLSQ